MLWQSFLLLAVFPPFTICVRPGAEDASASIIALKPLKGGQLQRVPTLSAGAEEISSAGHPLKILSFSDVHGHCLDKKSGPREITRNMGSHMQKFADSAAGQAIANTDADIIIFGGDATTIPDTVDCTELNFQELKTMVNWFKKVKPGTPKIFIGGNHDTCLDDSTVKPDGAKELRRAQLLKQMEDNQIHYIGVAGWIKIPLGGGQEFKVIASSLSEGRAPGAKYFADDYDLPDVLENGTVPEFGTEVKDKVDDKPLTMGNQMGAFQYCPRTAFSSYVDCAAVYMRATHALIQASVALGREADLVVIHGPPDNLGFKFGPGGGSGPPGLMAEAIMKPLIARKAREGGSGLPGIIRAGHYHPKSDWSAASRTQTITCDSASCKGSVELKFVPVKAARPEECEYPKAGDPEYELHLPDEYTFTDLLVTEIGEVTKGEIDAGLTKSLTGKYTHLGARFNTPEPTSGEDRSKIRKYKVKKVKRQGKEKQVIIPDVLA